MEINEDFLSAYLDGVFGLEKGFMELRYIPSDEGHVKRKFFESPFNNKQPINHIKRNWREGNNLYHVFCGVNLRSQRKSKERFLKKVNCFFCDIDAKDFDGGKAEAKQIIKNFPLTPTFVVDSGNGFHTYHRLKNPVEIKHRGDIEEAKQVSAKLHDQLCGDSTYDLSRILRMPGTYNVKEEPKLCKFDSISFQTYRFEQLKEVLPDKDLELNQQENLDLTLESDIDCMNDLTTRLPNAIMERAEIRPEKFKSDRSANDYWVAVKLFEQGLNDKEVKDAFKLFAKHDYDAGAKYKETGEQYLNKTISSAKSSYNKKNEAVNNIDSIEIID